MIVVLVLLILFLVWHVQICWEEETEAGQIHRSLCGRSEEQEALNKALYTWLLHLENSINKEKQC